MSASSVARWNAIPLARSDHNISANKRPRSDDGVSSDDNISVASRSPSPRPDGVGTIKDVNLYDEHVKGHVKEVITVETRIKSTNKGFAMLARLGWAEGQPLGISGDGRVDPIPFTVKRDLTGLGKATQDVKMIETTVSQRRGLDSERMVKETNDQRRLREESVAQKAAVQSEITNVLKAFFCTLCDKQFKNVAQYDEHTNSYAHHHKSRMRDMQANHPLKQGGKEEIERRKEKERKREAKELRKIAAAAGVKIISPPSASTSGAGSKQDGTEVKGTKKSGWAPVPSSGVSSDTSYPQTRTGQRSAPGGWAAVDNIASVSQSSRFGRPTLPNAIPPAMSSAPAFRTGGFTTLPSNDATIPPSAQGGGRFLGTTPAEPYMPRPPSPASAAPSAPPPDNQPPPPISGWSSFPPSSPFTVPQSLHPSTGGHNSVDSSPPSHRAGWGSIDPSVGTPPPFQSTALPPPPPPLDKPPSPPPTVSGTRLIQPPSDGYNYPSSSLSSQHDGRNQRTSGSRDQVRGNWQQWQRSRGQGGKR